MSWYFTNSTGNVAKEQMGIRNRGLPLGAPQIARPRGGNTCAFAGRAFLLGLLIMGGLPYGSLPSWAQAGPSAARVQVSGTVRDAGTRQALPGVAVRRSRPRQGGVTNAQGEFGLAAAPADTLFFHALGYKPYRLLVPGVARVPLVVQVYLQRDSVRLPEVQVTADRVDRTNINRALNNLKRGTPSPVKGPQQLPKPRPLFAVDSTPPPPPPFGASAIGWAYHQFSRTGKERRKMKGVKTQVNRQRAQQQRSDYNRVFKDNRSYE